MASHQTPFPIVLLLFTAVSLLHGQGDAPGSDDRLTTSVVESYIAGWREADTELLATVFAVDEGRVLWVSGDAPGEELKSMTFADVLRDRKPQPEYGLRWRIIASDVIAGKLASVKVHISRKGGSYTDLLVLQKIDDRWRIVTKTFVTHTD